MIISLPIKIYIKLSLALLATLLLFFVINVLNPSKANAAYQHGRLIDDAVFLDAKAMSAADIQNFLVSKNAGLKDMKFVLSCYGSDSTERKLYTSAGARCDTPIPASEIIYYAAQIYGVNPRVILATMQKEQSLTTAPNPTSWQLSQAMGYACPTSGSCSDSSSFSYQIDSGTWVLRYHYERANGNMSWWRPSTSWTCGTAKPSYYTPNLHPRQNVNFVDPYSGIQYVTVYIENAATSAFYCYTPHVFNNHNNSPHPSEPKGSSRCYSSHPLSGDRGRCYTGSYNFVYFYELWFGTTQIPDYRWQVLDQAFFRDSTHQNFIGNHAYEMSGNLVYARITVRNTGNAIWDKNSANPVRMGSIPGDASHPLCNSSWQWCARPAIQQEALVRPGENATFLFDFTMPAPGSRAFRYTLLSEGKSWFPDIGAGFEVNASPQSLKSEIVNQSLFYDANRQIKAGEHVLTMGGGRKIYATIVLRNTSNFSWDKNSVNAVKIAGAPRDTSHPLCSSTWLSCSRIAFQQEALVRPGENATFLFDFTMPNSYYKFVYSLLVEGRTWNSDYNKEFYLNGSRPNYSWQVSEQAFYRDEARQSYIGSHSYAVAGTKIYSRITVKNTGNYSWVKNSANPVRMGSIPGDASHPLCNSSWQWCARPAIQQEALVRPGENATFLFDFTMPAGSPVSRAFRYTLLAEQHSWFPDIWAGFEINNLGS